MPELTIRLKSDPVTGKKDIIISLQSDDDALPHEHEQLHRLLVDKMVEGGLIKASEIGKILVEREGEGGAAELPRDESAGERASESEGQ